MKNQKIQLPSRLFSRGTLISLKGGFILLLIFLITIPLWVIHNTISEREKRHSQAVAEISSAWSYSQHLAGPVLFLPYSTPITDKKGETQTAIKEIILLPESLKINVKVNPEVRYRGIFEAVVYKSEIEIKGIFNIPSSQEVEQLNFSGKPRILWDSAKFVLGITDMRRLKGGLTLNWHNQLLSFLPGSGTSHLIPSGIQVPSLDLQSFPKGKGIPFALKLHLDGSESLNFLPFGMKTCVSMQSSWPHPSFAGAFLPDQRQITREGFKAAWEISHFGRSYPQNFTTDQMNDVMLNLIKNSEFGVRFLQPVNAYHQSERAIKYGSLFLVFTFMTYFLFELITGTRIHIFQYALVGMSLCIFFLLLIALAEHIGFGWAYSLGAAFVITQISLYSLKVVKTIPRSLVIVTVLTLLYIYLYLVLRVEDYALLIGAFTLFLALGVIMFAVRNVGWFSTNRNPPETS